MCLSRVVFDLATDLRARHRLKTPDALHQAAAIRTRCDDSGRMTADWNKRSWDALRSFQSTNCR